MIILNVQGGLGNQIYQYNFALFLAKRLNTSIIVNNEILRKSNLDNELANIGIKYRALNPILGYLVYYLCSAVYKLNLRYFFNSKILYFYLDPECGYDSNLKKIKSKFIFLNGYFQSHHYLSENLDQLKEMIHSSLPNNSKNLSITNLVCVHVRRGDYLYINNKDIFFDLGKDYYLTAMDLMRKQCDGDVIFKVFSNDIQYCKSLFQETTFPMAFAENDDAIKDFREMIECDHYIIANSTFSLLASIFSKSKNKFVIAPKQWYKNNIDHSLVPNSFKKI